MTRVSMKGGVLSSFIKELGGGSASCTTNRDGLQTQHEHKWTLLLLEIFQVLSQRSRRALNTI
jgi:hypothetical protein